MACNLPTSSQAKKAVSQEGGTSHLIAAFLGFAPVAGMAWDAAWLLCLVFLLLFAVSLIFSTRRPPEMA